MGLQIDARRVLSTSGADCTGGPLAGEASDTMSYEVWTLHCQPASGDQLIKLVDALKAEVGRLGGTIDDQGEVVSHNSGSEGDAQVTLHGRFEAVELWIRVTSIERRDGSSIVVTVDQRL